MNDDTLKAAIASAKRFIVAGEMVLKIHAAGNDYDRVMSAAAKRASMDLTRALSQMRKPG